MTAIHFGFGGFLVVSPEVMGHVVLGHALATPYVNISFAWGKFPVVVGCVVHLILLGSPADYLVSRASELALVHNSVALHTLIHGVALELAEVILKLPPVLLFELVGK